MTLLRLENFAAPSTGAKEKLKAALKVYGKALELDPETWSSGASSDRFR